MKKFVFLPVSAAIALSLAFLLTSMYVPGTTVAAMDGEAPANGTLDTTFNAAVTDGESQTVTSEVLPDGKMLVGGNYQLVNGNAKSFLVKVNSDGSIDPTFNPGGAGPNSLVYEIIRLTDGKFLIAGSFTTYNGVAKSGLARLNADGTLDTAFNSGGAGTTGAVQGMVLQTDGKILISSQFSAYNGTSRFSVARVNADGSLDTTFTSPFTNAVFVEEVDVLSDGRILIAGVFNLLGRFDVMRLNSNGTADSSFNNGGVGTDGFGVFAMAVQPDGKILIGGGMNSYNGVPRPRGARLNADGSLDTSFVPPVFEEGNGPEWLDVQPDGKILAAGGFWDGVNAYSMIRMNSNGSLDAGFAKPAADGTGYHIHRQTDGSIILTGYFNQVNGVERRNIVRLTSSGAVDTSLNLSLTTYGQVFDIALQPDGKTIAAGNFRFADGTPRLRLARFNSDGSLDTTFDPGSSTFPDPVGAQNVINTVALQSDGKIMIGGTFGLYNGTVRRSMARLNTNGSIDLSFNAGLDDTEFVQSAVVQHLLVQPDGKIMAGGNVTFTDGTIELVGRLLSDGTVDTTFLNGNSTTGGSVQRIIRQADGKYIVVGNYNNIAGLNRNRITRLNADSSHDAAFNPGTGTNAATIFNAALQPDGKILIGGNFTSYNGTARARIARVNADGSLDTGFNVGTGANSTVLSFVLQPDSKILIGGFFSTYNALSANRLARLNPDGSLDSSFVSGFANDATASNVRRMQMQPDGRLLVAGTFRAYSGSPRNGILRVATAGGVATPTPTLTPTPTPTPPASPTPSPTPGSTPLYTRGDYDGDNKTDLTVWRPVAFDPNLSAFYTFRSTNGSFFGIQFGNAGDVAIAGDFDGDNKSDFGVSRFTSADGVDLIYLESSTNTAKFPVWGNGGDIFISGDYDGDKKTDVMAWRPSDGTWYIVNSSGANGGFSFITHGQSGDKPYAIDTDGDGKSNLVYFRPSTGDWVVRNNDGSTTTTNFGLSTDIPVPADYDGDNKDDIAVFRDGLWIVLKSSNGQVDFMPFGAAGDIPVPGDYDGDNLYDRAVYRQGIWHMLRSSAGYTGFQFGAPTDTAMPKAYIP